MCNDDGVIERGNVFIDIIVDLIEFLSEENSELIFVEEVYEELFEVIEDLFNVEEMSVFFLDVVVSFGVVESVVGKDEEK